MNDRFQQAVSSAFAGFIATGPMTLVMQFLHETLPRERRPLPPQVITERALQTVGLDDELSEESKKATTMAAHFGYGTAAGTLYGPLSQMLNLPPVLGGIGYGLAVGAASYLGWLPLAKLYPSALRETPERNLMLIAAHCVWGAVLGLMTERLRPIESLSSTGA